MLNKLEDVQPASAPVPGPERQGEIDATIHSKIRAELDKLRKQEADVQKQIELALEKENIERLGKQWFGSDKGQSSAHLEQELSALRAKIGKYAELPTAASFAGLQEARDAVVKCYRCVSADEATCRRARSTAGRRPRTSRRPSPLPRRSSSPSGSRHVAREHAVDEGSGCGVVRHSRPPAHRCTPPASSAAGVRPPPRSRRPLAH